METLFDEAIEEPPALGAGFELPDGWGWCARGGEPFPVEAMWAGPDGLVILRGNSEAEVALRAGHLARELRPLALADIDAVAPLPHVAGSPTSRKAALEVFPKAGTQRWQVVMALLEADQVTPLGYARGLTRDELAERTGLSPNAVRPRVVELIEGGWAWESPNTRPSAAGRDAALVVLTDGGVQEAMRQP